MQLSPRAVLRIVGWTVVTHNSYLLLLLHWDAVVSLLVWAGIVPLARIGFPLPFQEVPQWFGINRFDGNALIILEAWSILGTLAGIGILSRTMLGFSFALFWFLLVIVERLLSMIYMHCPAYAALPWIVLYSICFFVLIRRKIRNEFVMNNRQGC